MNTNNTNEKLLIYLDEFRSLLRDYDSNVITMSKFCEIINDKAHKIVSLNTELLEALQDIVNYHSNIETEFKGHKLGGTIPFLKAQAAIKKATE